MSKNSLDRTELIFRLRKSLMIPESIASDDELLQNTEGAKIRAQIELSMALEAAMRAFKAALPPILYRLFF